jgi:hypothetical protein
MHHDRSRRIRIKADAAGQTHRFCFEVRVLGDAADDLFELMGHMVPRIRRLLAQQDLKSDPHMPGLHIADSLRGGSSDSRSGIVSLPIPRRAEQRILRLP